LRALFARSSRTLEALVYNSPVSYEEAFTAFKNGDFQTAVPLLKKAADETAFASDIINHAYTLALYRIGDMRRLADVAFQIGNSLVQQDPASAMDYFQRAVTAGLDSKHVREIGELFEKWARPRSVTQSLARRGLTRVAHVVGCLMPSHTPAHYLQVLTSSLKKQGIESTIFTTEWAASWFSNPAGIAQSQTIEIEAEVKVASVEGDFLDRASRIAEAIGSSGIEAAFFHASLAEQITARVASMRAVGIQVGVNHGSEMDADLFDARIHLFQNAIKRTRFPDRTQWIPPASDIEKRLQTSQAITRKDMGLDSAGSISATFSNLDQLKGSAYLTALSEVMNRFPNHFHVFVGGGSVKAVRSHLHSEGVLPRIRFLGELGDVAPLLNMIDVYLASFPQSGGDSILDAMGAGKPVVVLRFPSDSPFNSASELVGVRELTASGEGEYIMIADRLLRNAEFRAKQGQAMLNRFRTEFHPDRLGERYKAFLDEICLHPGGVSE
jgi:glycosyltransferase involved in cell wall biosynthesis